MSIRRLLAAALLAAAACRARATSTDTAAPAVDTVRGVVHVRSSGPMPRWRLDSALTISTRSDGEGFGRIVSIVGDSAGTLYVADALNSSIEVVAPDGRALRRFGRYGAGPGEVRDLYPLAWLGDTLAALDPGNARIALFTPGGEPVGTLRWQALTGSPRSVRLYRAEQGAIFARIARPGAHGLVAAFVRYTGRGATDTLSEPAMDPRERTSYVTCFRPDGGISGFDVPFAPHTITTLRPDGRLVRAWSGEYRIAVLTKDGDTAEVVEREVARLPIADTQWDSALATFRDFRRKSPGARCEPDVPARPAGRPALRHLLFDARGRLWVEAATPGGWRWEVFDAGGRPLGAFPAPIREEEVEPFVGRGRLAVAGYDSLGQPVVRVYRFGEP